MTNLDAINKGEKALLAELDKNEAYHSIKGSDCTRLRNGIANAVNNKDKTYREKLGPGGKAYYDYLFKLADLYEKYGGVRPVWDMEELEW